MTCSHGKECPCARESNELRAEVSRLDKAGKRLASTLEWFARRATTGGLSLTEVEYQSRTAIADTPKGWREP